MQGSTSPRRTRVLVLLLAVVLTVGGGWVAWQVYGTARAMWTAIAGDTTSAAVPEGASPATPKPRRRSADAAGERRVAPAASSTPERVLPKRSVPRPHTDASPGVSSAVPSRQLSRQPMPNPLLMPGSTSRTDLPSSYGTVGGSEARREARARWRESLTPEELEAHREDRRARREAREARQGPTIESLRPYDPSLDD